MILLFEVVHTAALVGHRDSKKAQTAASDYIVKDSRMHTASILMMRTLTRGQRVTFSMKPET